MLTIGKPFSLLDKYGFTTRRITERVYRSHAILLEASKSCAAPREETFERGTSKPLSPFASPTLVPVAKTSLFVSVRSERGPQRTQPMASNGNTGQSIL
jgi:hypothetical protein